MRDIVRVYRDPILIDGYNGHWYRIDGKLVSGFELGHDCPRKTRPLKVVEQLCPSK